MLAGMSTNLPAPPSEKNPAPAQKPNAKRLARIVSEGIVQHIFISIFSMMMGLMVLFIFFILARDLDVPYHLIVRNAALTFGGVAIGCFVLGILLLRVLAWAGVEQPNAISPMSDENIARVIEQLFKNNRIRFAYDEPNLFYEAADETKAHKDERGIYIEGEAEGKETIKASIVNVKNRREGRLRVGSAVDLRATIHYTFFDVENRWSEHVPRGTWLSEAVDTVTIEPDKSRKLVIATIENNQVCAVGRFEGSLTPRLTTCKELLGELVAVSVQLVTEVNGKDVGKIDFMLEITRTPSLTMSLLRTHHWKGRKLLTFTKEGNALHERINTEGATDELKQAVNELREARRKFGIRHLREPAEAPKPPDVSGLILRRPPPTFADTVYGDTKRWSEEADRQINLGSRRS